MDDGDDCLVIIEKDDEHKLVGIRESFLDFGHEVKIENRATCLEEVVFCQSSPVRVGGEYVFVRNPIKVLSNAPTGFLKLRDHKLRKKMLYAVGTCELALNVGIPILQELATKLIELGEVCDVDKLLTASTDFADMEYRMRGVHRQLQPRPIETATRLSFMQAFGISIQQQLDIETVVRSWAPDIFDEVVLPYDQCRDLRMPTDISLTGI